MQPGTTDTTGGGQYDCCWQVAWDGPYATEAEALARLNSGAHFYRPCAAEPPSTTTPPTTTAGCAHCSDPAPDRVWVEIGGVTGDCALANGDWECERVDDCAYSVQTSNGTVTVEFLAGGIGVTYDYPLSSGGLYWLYSASAPHDCCAERQAAFTSDSGDCQGAGEGSTCILRPVCPATSTDDATTAPPEPWRCADNDLGCDYAPDSVAEAGGQWYVIGRLASEGCCDPDARTTWAGSCGTTGDGGCCSPGFDRNISNWTGLADAEAYGQCHPVLLLGCDSYSPGGCEDNAVGCVFVFDRAVDYREEYSTTYGPTTLVYFARYRLACENCDRTTTTFAPTTTAAATTTTGAAECAHCSDDDPVNPLLLTISGVTCGDGDANGGDIPLSGTVACEYEYFNPYGIWTVIFGDDFIRVTWLSQSRNGGVVWQLDLSAPYSCCASRSIPFLSDWGSCEGTGGDSTCDIEPSCS
jgi:hypothetical protein